MALIFVKGFGYTIKGNLLDLKIKIPKNTFIKRFKVAYKNQILENDTISDDAIDYITCATYARGVKVINDIEREETFNKIFIKTGEEEIDAKGNIYYVYELDNEFEWALTWNDRYIRNKGININEHDYYVLFLEINIPSPLEYMFSDNCEEDTGMLMYPLFHKLSLEIDALSHAKFLDCSCIIPYETIHKLLQIKLIETCSCIGKFHDAIKHWDNFYKNRKFNKNYKGCGCGR